MKQTTLLPNQQNANFSLSRIIGINESFRVRAVGVIMALVIISNIITHTIFNPFLSKKMAQEPLYLMEKASMFITDEKAFEQKVRDVANRLEIQPEWLMSVMYSESRFDAAAENLKGSGAVGLIQFMPTTALGLNTTTQKLGKMTPVAQLEYVYEYLAGVKRKYGGFESLTELYLAILFPKALEGDYCYTLYAKPSQAYKQNAGLDEDNDGRVTVSDIDRRMQRVFPKGYIAGKKPQVNETEATQQFVHEAGF